MLADHGVIKDLQVFRVDPCFRKVENIECFTFIFTSNFNNLFRVHFVKFKVKILRDAYLLNQFVKSRDTKVSRAKKNSMQL